MILVVFRTVLLVQRPWTKLWKGRFINTNYYYYYDCINMRYYACCFLPEPPMANKRPLWAATATALRGELRGATDSHRSTEGRYLSTSAREVFLSTRPPGQGQTEVLACLMERPFKSLWYAFKWTTMANP